MSKRILGWNQNMRKVGNKLKTKSRSFRQSPEASTSCVSPVNAAPAPFVRLSCGTSYGANGSYTPSRSNIGVP